MDVCISGCNRPGVLRVSQPSSPPNLPRSTYVHVPFCRHRCGYCNFTLIAGRDDLIPAYLEALAIELSHLDTPLPMDTIFLGGGTPSHLSPTQLKQLFSMIHEAFPLRTGGEFSLEANPADINHERVELFADAGVNRISLGIQSFDDQKLATLERDHRANTIFEATKIVASQIDNLSLDLIFGVPGETRATWQRDLQQAVALAPQHISTYGLTYEPGTSFWSRRQKQQLSPLAEDDEAWMYELAIDTLTAKGFEHYEVSNFAQQAYRSKHNQVYWTGAPYFAIGPGAARFVDGVRETNHRSTTTYLKRVMAGQSPVAERETLTPEQLARERLVFGLRRMQGVDADQFATDTGFSIENLAGSVVDRCCEQGWLQWQGRCLQLTRSGLLLSDSLWPEFL